MSDLETQDNDYVSRPGQKQDAIPVQSDNDSIESGIDEKTADSEEQLVKDDTEAIDESNVIGERTRGAKPEGSYREPGDTEGLEDERLES